MKETKITQEQAEAIVNSLTYEQVLRLLAKIKEAAKTKGGHRK